MDERTVGARNRGSKFDEITKDIDLAGEHYQLEMYENNEVISKNLNNATPLNGNVSDVNLMKTFITALNESDRFEDQDFENLTLGSAKYVAEQDFKLQVPHPKERRARRNVPGKRKSRAGTLCEIKLSSVENLDQTTEQLSPKHSLVANNRHNPVQTLNERKMLKLTKISDSQLGVQLSAYQEETFETANVPVITPTELDLPSEDRTPSDFPCKSATWETEESTVQTIGRDGETWTSFPATLGGCDTISEINSENTAYRHHNYLVNVDKEQSKSCATKIPNPSLDISKNAANQWEMTAETFNLNSAGKLAAERKRYSRRVSSVGARGSPETNSLICYIANQKMQESQSFSSLKSKMAAFMVAFQDDNINSVPELPHLSGLWQTGSTAKEQDCTLSTSCSRPTQKKKVTFGEELTPELFDKRLPSNTPLRRGEMPVHQQITFSDSPPSALKRGSKTKTGLEERKSISDDVTCNGSSPVKDQSDSSSSKLQTKLEDDLEICAAGTQNVEEDRCCPIAINFEIESPLSECKYGPDNLQRRNKNDEYPCEVLEVKIEELTETLPLPISSSGHPRKRKNARKQRTKKKPNSKKLLKIQPDVDKNIPAINMLDSSEIEAESVVESDMKPLPSTEISKTGDGFLDQNKTDYSSNGGVQTNFIGDSCLNIKNLPEQRDETEDKNVCNKALDADVILNPTTKTKEKVKTRNGEHESKKEQPRRSGRIKDNVNNISKNSSTATKGKRRHKFKKDLYGKREYASKKPLLSPIAEVLDIWSESADFSDSEVRLECEPPKRTSLIHLKGIDRGRRHSMSKSELLADGWTPGCTLSKSVGQKPRGRGRPRKSAVHCFEKEQKIQSDVEGETQKGNTGDHRLVPRRLNQFDYNLKCDNSQLPPLSENKKDMAFEVKWTDNVAKDVTRGKSFIKIKSKPFSKLPVLIKSSQQGITDTQSPSEGQCEMETGHEEYFERINTNDYGGAGSLLESESDVLEDINERRDKTEPNEMEKLIPIGASVSEKSQETISESVTGDITVFDENIISPPEAREDFRSGSSHRQSKLFSAIDLPYVTQSEQVLKNNGCCVVDAGDENEEKGKNLAGRKERLSWKGIADPTVPCQIDDGVDTANCESLLFNFGDHCFLEQINTNMLETVDQLETCIKYSDGFLRNTKSKKKVRRSSRLSGCMNSEGLRWIEVTSPQHLEKRNKNITMRRRSLGFIELECNMSNAEDIEQKIASQARMRKLRRRSLSCNRERAFELEEPRQKSMILD